MRFREHVGFAGLQLAAVFAPPAARARLAARLRPMEAQEFNPAALAVVEQEAAGLGLPRSALGTVTNMLAPAKQQMEAALGRTLDARHYTFLSATYFNTRDPAKLRFLLAAYDAVDGTNDKNVAAAAAVAAAIENNAGPNEQTQRMVAQTFGGDATHTGEDRALYASGWVEGKWALIKSQCVVCHGTPNLTGAQHGACQRCGRGLCGAHCRRVHEALDHCH
ncbi:hypothetical protein TSOC_004520 [Tetrabaena socialis]|uniref:Uncharacterized protein n=1 Tax=Tetrabaena socialis TaxID=47790 RepID=A0A2J8A8R8_9CHLO|nr:hypothetical protein TSOC_004520 [Tetrabaena socialis]|eukprot:PNH08900.1 hypothetical protein TSOC_004520 [Tetrabaena socialis]